MTMGSDRTNDLVFAAIEEHKSRCLKLALQATGNLA
jgi:hypothetical protein